MRTLLLTLTTCLLVLPAYAQYGGGSGTAQDPYQIASAADLIALGNEPNDYDKHFLLAADIDLDPNLPGREVFDKAVVAPDTDQTKDWFQGTPFTGVFDGNGHTISHLTIAGGSYVGLFGRLDSGAEVKNLAIVDVNITGSGVYVGGLVGSNGAYVGTTKGGAIINCYSTGTVSGSDCVGGLVGSSGGTVTGCYSAGTVSGGTGYNGNVGGLVGYNGNGSVTQCYSTGAVSGRQAVGGFAGTNAGVLIQCYSTCAVSGDSSVGGLVGSNFIGIVTCSYSAGLVKGKSWIGGLVGFSSGKVTHCFWDIETSGQTKSDGGVGKGTAEMKAAKTFLGWGGYGWTLDEGRDYPRLAWENTPGDVSAGPVYGGGTGTAQDPYLIYTAQQLNSIGLAACNWDGHFRLMADVDLSGFDGEDGRPEFNTIALGWESPFALHGTPFTGVFDGNGHRISHLMVKTEGRGGLFGLLEGEVRDLGVVDVNVTSSYHAVGALVGRNGGTVTRCYSTGKVGGGTDAAGGLVGLNYGAVTQCYSTAAVSSTEQASCVGGLVGEDNGAVTQCYSAGTVSGIGHVGGLVGSGNGDTSSCFWDIQTSGQAKSAGGTGKTTAQMRTAKTFLDAGWDFVGETANGTEDIWWISEGKDYPRLWWEATER